MRERVEEYVFQLQDEIVSAFEKLDPTAPPFKRDSWIRAQGGSGRSCVFACPPQPTSSSPSGISTPASESNANLATQREIVLEKGGVNVSVVHGLLPPAAIKQMRADHNSMPLPEGQEGLPFFAAGLSLVIHPRNPHAPTVHANYRYFEITEPVTQEEGSDDAPKKQGKVLVWWFGGGSDLTPSYLYEEDAIHFHKTISDACAPHGSDLYPTFKKWCDEYFYIAHRHETRGIGGIFFDDLNAGPHARFPNSTNRPSTPDEIFAFVRSVGNSFVPSYIPILAIRHTTLYNEHERRWQLLRRGRYVEFNLVYDRGTKFGLMTPGARIESILMSLPETARWEYMSEMGTEEGTEEERLMKVLKMPREWI